MWKLCRPSCVMNMSFTQPNDVPHLDFVKLGDLQRSRINPSSVELFHKFVVQPKFVKLETELVLAVERVLLIPSLNFDGAISP